MFKQSTFTRLVEALAAMFVPRLPHDKPAKRYPTMVVSSPYAINEWNEAVRAANRAKGKHRA